MITTAVPPGWIPLKIIVNVFVGIWAPVFFGWIAIVLFDSKEMRTLMHEALHVSVAGPYVLYWLAIGDVFLQARWTDWGWYLTLIIGIAYTVASICYSAIFVPKVRRWLDNTPIKEYPAAQAEQISASG